MNANFSRFSLDVHVKVDLLNMKLWLDYVGPTYQRAWSACLIGEVPFHTYLDVIDDGHAYDRRGHAHAW